MLASAWVPRHSEVSRSATEPADLLDQLQEAAAGSDVSLRVLQAGGTEAAATAGSAATGASATAGSTAAGSTAADATTTDGTDPRAVPFAVEVTGGYVGVAAFLERVHDAVRRSNARVTTDGRLLRVRSADLDENTEGGPGRLRGKLELDAYVLPGSRGAGVSMADAKRAK
ncbi:hypothetical protein ACVU7I_17180 [Patulibacter sp. S7RM1-6]